VTLYILIVGPPALIWTAVSRDARFIYAAGALGVRIGFGLAGIRLIVKGREHLQPGAAVYACNHSSNVEPPAVFVALAPLFPKLRILYKAELRRIPLLVWVFDAGGFVPLERSNPGQSWPAITRAAGEMAQGNSFVIFPEGTRSPDGTLLPFKKGAFVAAITLGVPIVPVVCKGTTRIMPKGRYLSILPGSAELVVLEPIPTTGMTYDDRDRLLDDVRGRIEAELNRNGD
jgi:1-acyl-sn-glycerol-3-phosphate acyltransferase